MGSGNFMLPSRTLFPPVTPDYDRRCAAALTPLVVYEVFKRLNGLSELSDRPLLLWHGDVDPLVPPGESARRPPSGAYLTEPEIGHKITVARSRHRHFFSRRSLALRLNAERRPHNQEIICYGPCV